MYICIKKPKHIYIMFKTEEEKNYFLKDYPNFKNISLQHKDQTRRPRKYSACSKDSRSNSKIMIFTEQKFNYLCLDCDKGITKLNPAIIDFLNHHNIVHFITTGTWTEGKPKDSASLCIHYKNYNSETRTKLNKLFIVISRLPNDEMSCDPLAVGDQMKSVFTDQMESRYYNTNGGNIFDLEKLTKIAYSHFNRKWDEVKHLADKYHSEAYYKKYKELIMNDFDDICISKLECYYYNMRKHNYDNWLYDSEIIDAEVHVIFKKYKSLPLQKKIETVNVKTLIRDYVLINWCKHDGYEYELQFFANLLWKNFKMTSKRIYKVRNDLEIQIFETSEKYLDFVSLIENEHLFAIKNKLNECRTKSRNRTEPTKPHKVHKNKGKFTFYTIEKNGKTKTVNSTEKSAYLKRGWKILFQ